MNNRSECVCTSLQLLERKKHKNLVHFSGGGGSRTGDDGVVNKRRYVNDGF